MKKNREIKVLNAKAALKLMLSMLSANMLDNELEVDKETGEYKIRLGWFSRDADAEDKVGCPCFVCKYHGFIPGDTNCADGIIYVKAFGVRNGCMTKMHFICSGTEYHFEEIGENQTFGMDETDVYRQETFRNRGNEILREY